MKDEDYYRNKTPFRKKTILNSDMACLRRCEDLLREMREKGKTLFEDPDFGPKTKIDHAQDSIYFSTPPSDCPNPNEIKWLRPKTLSKDRKPEFIDAGAETNDVMQGALGDCWFIGAMSVLASHDEYIRGDFDPKKNLDGKISDLEAKGMSMGVYPPMFHYLRKHGMYVMRFFKDYGWRYVIIDDRLPCFDRENWGQPELVFASCR